MVTKNDVGLNTDLSFTLSDQLDIFGIGFVSPALFVNNIVLNIRLGCAHSINRNPETRDFYITIHLTS